MPLLRLIAKSRYVLGLCADEARCGNHSVARQLAEIVALMLLRGVGYDYYHYAGMSRRDVPFARKLRFLGRARYRRLVAQLNPVKYRGISQFKPIEKAFFQQFGIATPRYLGTLHARHGISCGGFPLRDGSGLSAWMRSMAPARICFKPVEGASGTGFQAYDIVRGGAVLHALDGGADIDVAALATRLLAADSDGWLIEEWVEQHPELARFNPSSLNTIRLMMLESNDGSVRCLGAFLKTGCPGALIDKTEGGGAAVHVDVDTGLLVGGFDWSPAMTPLDAHPASGEVFAGASIPHWREALTLACRAVGACPGLRFAGVDVAITDGGPLMIEMNPLPDADCLPVLGLTEDELCDVVTACSRAPSSSHGAGALNLARKT